MTKLNRRAVTVLAALAGWVSWVAPAARATCHCDLEKFAGGTGVTFAPDGAHGPCGDLLSAAKLLAVQQLAAAPRSNAISAPEVQAAAAAGSSTTHVIVGDSFFSEPSVTVKAGDTVQWDFQGAFHTVTSDDGLLFDSGGRFSGDTFTFTFTTPGSYGYYCQFHGGPGFGMSGTVNVTAAPEPGTAALLLAPLAATAMRRRRRGGGHAPRPAPVAEV
jgi:plastocyanin